MRSLILIFVFSVGLFSSRFAADCQGQTQVTVTWALSTSANVTGYYLAWGTSSGDYTATNTYMGAQTNGTITNLQYNVVYYIAVAAFASNGMVSPFSAEITVSNAAPTNETVNAPPPPPVTGKSLPGPGPGPSSLTIAPSGPSAPPPSGGKSGPGSSGLTPNVGSQPSSSSGSSSSSSSNNVVQAQIWGIPPLLNMTLSNNQPLLTIGGIVGSSVNLQSTASPGSPYSWTTVTNIALSNAAPIPSDNVPGQPKDAIDLAYVPALQSTPLPLTSSSGAQFFRVVMPYDYVILASLTLPPQGYTARLIVVNMPGLNDDGCYVQQAGSFIHYTATNSSLQLESSGSTIRQIATTLAESLNLDWTTASEFTYSNGMGQILATVVEADPPSSDPVAGQNPPSSPIVINF